MGSVNGGRETDTPETQAGEHTATANGASGPLAIAIDGPAASGKSTIGHALARDLGLLYLDTGAMYRAVTWLALQRGVDPSDEASVTRLAEQATFAFPALDETGADRVNPPVIIDGVDATAGIREPAVDRTVSAVSAYSGVRAALVRHQRRIARERGVVMVGRDIGTVVLPDARLKIFLVADAAERAHRRYEERAALGKEANFDAIREDMARRDRLDSERAHSPLRPADDAVRLDTTGLDIPEVVARALDLARRAGSRL